MEEFRPVSTPTGAFPRAAGLAPATALRTPRAAFKTFASARRAEGRDRHGAYYAKHPQTRVPAATADFVTAATNIRLKRVTPIAADEPRDILVDFTLPRGRPDIRMPVVGEQLHLVDRATNTPLTARVVRHLAVNEPGRRTGRMAVRVLTAPAPAPAPADLSDE